jgi:hypothetical protein
VSVSAAVLGSLADTEARSAYTCALGQAPTANNLILVGVLVSDTAGTPVEPTGVIGGGMVFSLITSSVTYNGAVASELHNLSAWRSMSASPVNSVITATFPNAGTGCAMLVHEVSGVSTSGTSGDRAVAKSAISEDNGGASAITIVGPSATSTANAWLSLLGISASGSTDTPGHDWSFLESTGYGTPATGIKSAWTTLSTGTVATWIGPGAERRGAIMIELVADNPPAAGVAVTYNRMERIPERIPAVPSNIQGPIRDYLEVVRRQLNAEAYISKFSGTDPNTSGVSGVPGNLVVNVGSASTATRLWLKKGAAQSVSTISWVPLRVA